MGGGGFAVGDGAVAVFDGEAVVCGVSVVDACVEGDGCGVALDGGVEGVGAGFASRAPDGGVCGGFARVCSCVVVALFGCVLWCERVSWLFAGVLDAGVGDPCVGDGADGVAVREGDGGGVSVFCAGVSAFVVVVGCVGGDSVVVRVACVLALVRVCECACVFVRGCVSCEGEGAVFGGHDGFADQHVCECLLFVLHPFVDLVLCECYVDGGGGLVLVAWGGEGAGGDVGVPGADGGGRGFALVEEDECEAGDGARVARVGVEVCSFDDALVGFCAWLCGRVLVAVVCVRCVGGCIGGVAVAEGDGEVGAVAECDDVAVVAGDVAAVEEFVEGGGELGLVAGGVLCGACWCGAVFDVVPRVHCWFLFLSVASRLFSCTVVACSSRARVWRKSGRSMRSRGRFSFRARFSVRHGIMVVLLAKRDCRGFLWTVSCLVRV